MAKRWALPWQSEHGLESSDTFQPISERVNVSPLQSKEIPYMVTFILIVLGLAIVAELSGGVTNGVNLYRGDRKRGKS